MRKKRKTDTIKEVLTYFNRDKTILEQVKKDNNVVYGARAVRKHIGFVGRPTQDYDVISRSPRSSANKLTRNLNKQAGYPYYFSKPAVHPGTFKVKHIGADFKKDTDDDIEIADFTKPSRKLKTTKIEGINYVNLSETIKDKKASLADPQYAFRHEKDREDYQRIKLAQQYNIKYRGDRKCRRKF